MSPLLYIGDNHSHPDMALIMSVIFSFNAGFKDSYQDHRGRLPEGIRQRNKDVWSSWDADIERAFKSESGGAFSCLCFVSYQLGVDPASI
jgi:hypothetical protein